MVLPSKLFADTRQMNADFCDQKQSDKVVFCNDFEDDELGVYTTDNLIKDWPNLQSLSTKFDLLNLGVTQQRVEVVKLDKHIDNYINNPQVLKIKYPKGKFGSWQSGATWIMKFPKAYEQLSFEYKVKFKEGFLFTRDGLFGGKLPGLMGGETISGGATADGRNGWTSRLMWGQRGRGLGYLYYPDMKDDKYNRKACPRHGQASEDCVIYRNKYFTFDKNSNRKCLSEWAAYPYEFRFDTERFYKIKQRIQMNTLPAREANGDSNSIIKQGNRDGELKIWLDDVLVLDCTNIRFRDVPELAIDSLIFSTFFGGNTPESSAHPHDEVIYFDDFLISVSE